jgi:tetratricopeptide (TPR) repeat protein
MMIPTSVSGRRVLLFGAFVLALSVVWQAAAAGTPKRNPVTDSGSSDPHYWFQKGALCATYGNNPAAIHYFSKAIALNPSYSNAYFSLGVAYGQQGNHARALAHLSRAIEMEPRNGLFYYGRARTYLLSGNKEQAMLDFHKAAELGDEDAQTYLNGLR